MIIYIYIYIYIRYFLILIAVTAALTGFHAGTNAAVAYAAWTDSALLDARRPALAPGLQAAARQVCPAQD